jgi:hypothetical protein
LVGGLMLVYVMPKMLPVCLPLLMQTIATHHAPGSLERQKNHQEDNGKALNHGPECTRKHEY